MASKTRHRTGGTVVQTRPRVRTIVDGRGPDRWIHVVRAQPEEPDSDADPRARETTMPPVVQQMFGGDDTVVYDTRQSVLKGHNGRLQIETDSDVDLDILTLLQQRGTVA